MPVALASPIAALLAVAAWLSHPAALNAAAIPPTALALATDTPGSGDCEARLDTWGQPALLVTSAAYVVAGIVVVLWGSRRSDVARAPMWLYAVGLAAAGLGSMDYHGPALGPQPLLHDAGLALALVVGLGVDLHRLGLPARRTSWALAGTTAALIGIIAIAPGLSPALASAAAVALVAAEALIYRRHLRKPGRALWAALGCLAVGGAVFALSRTGGPLCDPDSLLQGHALWHLLTATALVLWAITALPGTATSTSAAPATGPQAPTAA